MPDYADYAQVTFGAVMGWGAMTPEEFELHMAFARDLDEKVAHLRGAKREMEVFMIADLANIALSYHAPWTEAQLQNAFAQSLPNALIRESAAAIAAWNHYLSDARADVIVVQNPIVVAAQD
jgi:hypothetical protein